MHYLYIYRVLGCDFLSEFSWLWKIFWLQVFLYDCLLCMYTYLLVVIRIWSLFVNWCFDSLHTSNFITFCVSYVPKKTKDLLLLQLWGGLQFDHLGRILQVVALRNRLTSPKMWSQTRLRVKNRSKLAKRVFLWRSIWMEFQLGGRWTLQHMTAMKNFHLLLMSYSGAF